jgi:hypothetical protein
MEVVAGKGSDEGKQRWVALGRAVLKGGRDVDARKSVG